ncbi:nucleolar protein 14 [Tanacetum coccineum]
MIAEAMSKVGRQGIVTIEEEKSAENNIIYVGLLYCKYRQNMFQIEKFAERNENACAAKFEDIFDVNHLIDYLKDDLQIVRHIPSLFAEKSKLFTSIRFSFILPLWTVYQDGTKKFVLFVVGGINGNRFDEEIIEANRHIRAFLAIKVAAEYRKKIQVFYGLLLQFPSRCYGPAILLMSEYLTSCLVTSGLRMWQLAPSCAQWFICLPAVKKSSASRHYFVSTRDYEPDRQRAEDRKLKKLMKREAKGAARELRKDNYFLAEVKARDKARLDAKKAEEHGRARAFLQEQDLDFFANTSTEMLELFNEEEHILDMKIVSGDYRLQEESIPIALTYSDILARAKNEIGKTTTFRIPAIDYQCTSWD